MSERLRVAVIGCGQISRYVRALRAPCSGKSVPIALVKTGGTYCVSFLPGESRRHPGARYASIQTSRHWSRAIEIAAFH